MEKHSIDIGSSDIAIDNVLLFHSVYKKWMVIFVCQANYFFNELGQVKLPLTAMHAVVLSFTNVATMQLFPLLRKTGRVFQT